jgi:hypothetical protein
MQINTYQNENMSYTQWEQMKFQIEVHLKNTPWNKIKANEVSEAFSI